jgi:hypothetical protein
LSYVLSIESTTGLLFYTYIALYLIRLATIPTPVRTPNIRP